MYIVSVEYHSNETVSHKFNKLENASDYISKVSEDPEVYEVILHAANGLSIFRKDLQPIQDRDLSFYKKK